jgi:hypothetical protein
LFIFFVCFGVHFLKTIVKVRVGCVKLSTYDLPSKDHVYGRVLPPDEEGAGQVISNWVASDPSVKKESESKIVYTNVLAIKNGYVLCFNFCFFQIWQAASILFYSILFHYILFFSIIFFFCSLLLCIKYVILLCFSASIPNCF